MSAALPPLPDPAVLAQRVNELEVENARLARRADVRGGRWRAIVSAVCIVMASILVPVSIMGGWARAQLVDEDAFVATLGPVIAEVAVQELIIDETMSAVRAQVDFRRLTGELFDGIADLGLPPRATAALDLLRQPAADGLAGLVESTVTTAVSSPAFADVWESAIRGVHRGLVLASTSDGGGIIVLDRNGVGIALSPLIDEVKQTLAGRGIAAAALIPSVERTIMLGGGSTLITIRTAYATTATMGWWMPVITLALFGLGLALARRRSTAVLGAGIGIALSAGILAAALSVGAVAAVAAAVELDLSPAALETIYGLLTDSMRHTASILAALGALIALAGWLGGRSRPAVRIRAVVAGATASAQRALAARGVNTGRFGAWLARRRVTVRLIVAALAGLWLFAVRPPGIGQLLLTVIVALVLVWVLAVLAAPARQGAEAASAPVDPAGPPPADDAEPVDPPTTSAAAVAR